MLQWAETSARTSAGRSAQPRPKRISQAQTSSRARSRRSCRRSASRPRPQERSPYDGCYQVDAQKPSPSCGRGLGALSSAIVSRRHDRWCHSSACLVRGGTHSSVQAPCAARSRSTRVRFWERAACSDHRWSLRMTSPCGSTSGGVHDDVRPDAPPASEGLRPVDGSCPDHGSADTQHLVGAKHLHPLEERLEDSCCVCGVASAWRSNAGNAWCVGVDPGSRQR